MIKEKENKPIEVKIKKWKKLSKEEQDNALIAGVVFFDDKEYIFVPYLAKLKGFLLINKKTSKLYGVEKTKYPIKGKVKNIICGDFLDGLADNISLKKNGKIEYD